MTIRLGLFDNLQIDPVALSGENDPGARYTWRLDDLALADELGFAVAFTAERHFMPNYQAPAPNVFVAAATQRTTRIRLGVLAYTLPLHQPFRLAEEIAVLDHLSGGRLEVGIGLGHRPEELAAIGVDPAERIPIFQERLALLRALWTGGQIGIESPHNILRDLAIHPLPLQEPHPPLWYAGSDPTAAAWAASQGMNLAVGFAPASRLKPTTDAFHANGQENAGHVALLRHAYVAESDERAMTEIEDDLMRLHEIQQSHGEGSRADRRTAARDHAVALVKDELAVAGGPDTVAGLVRSIQQTLRIDCFLANPYLAGVERERVRRTLRLFADEVAPRLEAPTES